LLRSVYRSVFMASVVERSETPMNLGALLYYNNAIQLFYSSFQAQLDLRHNGVLYVKIFINS